MWLKSTPRPPNLVLGFASKWRLGERGGGGEGEGILRFDSIEHMHEGHWQFDPVGGWGGWVRQFRRFGNYNVVFLVCMCA